MQGRRRPYRFRPDCSSGPQSWTADLRRPDCRRCESPADGPPHVPRGRLDETASPRGATMEHALSPRRAPSGSLAHRPDHLERIPPKGGPSPANGLPVPSKIGRGPTWILPVSVGESSRALRARRPLGGHWEGSEGDHSTQGGLTVAAGPFSEQRLDPSSPRVGVRRAEARSAPRTPCSGSLHRLTARRGVHLSTVDPGGHDSPALAAVGDQTDELLGVQFVHRPHERVQPGDVQHHEVGPLPLL